MGQLEVVQQPDRREVGARFSEAQKRHRRFMDNAWIGTLVTEFTTEELRVVIENLTIGDVLTLRSLGVLGPDEGWTG